MSSIEDFIDGIKESITHIVLGIILSVIPSTLILTGIVSSNFSFLFGVINAVIVIAMILILTKSGFIYLAGWIIGVVFLIQGGLVNTGYIGITELIIDLGAPLGIAGLKAYLLFKS